MKIGAEENSYHIGEGEDFRTSKAWARIRPIELGNQFVGIGRIQDRSMGKKMDLHRKSVGILAEQDNSHG